MTWKTLAHISDLHIGKNMETDRRAKDLSLSLQELRPDHIVLTGDVLHRGRHDELARFYALFQPLLEQGRLHIVPGNHDRLGDDAGAAFLNNERVVAEEHPGIFIVRVDSTGEHNKSFFASHGELCEDVIETVQNKLNSAPPDSLRVLAFHHHPLPLPEDSFWERVWGRLGSPHTLELALGHTLLQRIRGTCDLVLHGHRHVPRAQRLFAESNQSLWVHNAGSSSELQNFALFAIRGRDFHYSRVSSHHGSRVAPLPLSTYGNQLSSPA